MLASMKGVGGDIKVVLEGGGGGGIYEPESSPPIGCRSLAKIPHEHQSGYSSSWWEGVGGRDTLTYFNRLHR